MDNPELKNRRSFSAEEGIHHTPKWLSSNIDETNRSADQIPKEIKELSDIESTKILSEAKEISRLTQSSVDNFFTLASPEPQMQEPENSDCASPHGTPEFNSNRKQSFNNHHGLDVSFDSGGGTGDSSLSLKDGTEFSSSSSDSESESFNSSINNNYLISPTESDGQGPNKKFLEQETEIPSIKGTFWMGEEDKESYDQLYDRFMRTEEELQISNLKLELSEKEVARLKSELEKNETTILLLEELQDRLELVENDKQETEAELQEEKWRVAELQEQITQLETRAVDFVSEIKRLAKESEMSRDMLKDSEDEIAKLTHELENAKSDHHQKIKELEIAFQVSLQQFHTEKAQLQSDYLRQVEAQKTELEALHIAQQTALKGEISQLKEGISQRTESLEALNKAHDELKLKYGTLMAEKDGVNATVHTLLAEKESKENQVHELEEEKMGLIAVAERLQKNIDDLKLRLSNLEEEVKVQRAMIEDGNEGKREAIRQLCSSLEHYRSGYQELRQVFIGQRQRTALTA